MMEETCHRKLLELCVRVRALESEQAVARQANVVAHFGLQYSIRRHRFGKGLKKFMFSRPGNLSKIVIVMLIRN